MRTQARYDDKAIMAKHLREARAIKIFKLEPGFHDYECFGCGKHGTRYEIYYLHPESSYSVQQFQENEGYFSCDNMRLGPDCAKKISKLAGIKLSSC